MAKTALPRQGAQIRSLVRELDPTCHELKSSHAAAKIPHATGKTQHSQIERNLERPSTDHATPVYTQTSPWLAPPFPKLAGPLGSQHTILLPPGTLTVEQIYQDRDQFAKLVREVAAPDVGRMGIEILSFTIKVQCGGKAVAPVSFHAWYGSLAGGAPLCL